MKTRQLSIILTENMNLKITECISCPFHKTSNYDESHSYSGDDCFFIKCTHEDQETLTYFGAKIKNKDNNIYFNCPLKQENENYFDE